MASWNATAWPRSDRSTSGTVASYMPLTVAAAQKVVANIAATSAPARNHEFENFIRVKYHSVSVGSVHSGGSARHHTHFFQ